MWLVGDRFLKEIFYSLPAMRNERKNTKTQQLFIYEQFNVHGIFPSNFHSMKSALGRVINTCIYGLNKFEKLPKLLLVILDKDLLDDIKIEESGSSIPLGMAIEWLVGEMDKMINRKRLMMKDVKPGSITNAEPKLLWLKMIARPRTEARGRLKFDDILEDILATRKNHFILQPDDFIDRNHFNRLDDLTVSGREEFWRCVDQNIKNFEKEQISLIPLRTSERRKLVK